MGRRDKYRTWAYLVIPKVKFDLSQKMHKMTRNVALVELGKSMKRAQNQPPENRVLLEFNP